MVMRFFKAGWRAKSKVATDQYAPMLSSALALAAAPDSTELPQLAALLAQLQSLQTISPQDARLGEVHVHAVGYLRGFLKVQDHWVLWQRKVATGDRKAASKDWEAMKHWQSSLDEVEAEFSQSLKQLKVKHPSLYEQLRIPESFA